MTTSSHPNSSSMPYMPRVLNPTPISFAPPSAEAVMGTANPIPSVPVKETDSTKKSKKSKKPKSNEESPAASTGSKKGKKPKSDEDSPSVSSDLKRPDWLPEEWTILLHIRGGGKTAGTKDKYYIEKGTGRKLRSLVEVRRHLNLEDAPKSNKRKKSPERKSGEASSSNKKESKKQKAERETTANGKENKKSKVGDDKINGEQCAKKQEEI